MKGVEASPVEAGRAAPNLEACTGCRSPSPVWISAELSPLSPAPPPPLPWYQCRGLCLRATSLVTHLVSSLVPKQLGCVLGGCLLEWQAAGTCWVRSAVSSSRVGPWEGVLWPEHFVCLFGSPRVPGLGLSDASSMCLARDSAVFGGLTLQTDRQLAPGGWACRTPQGILNPDS